MFKTMKQLFTSTNKDLRHRIYFTLGALMIFILGISIRVPGTEKIGSDLGFLELINVMGGGALKNFSIFALGVMPYITASIIMQLLQMDIIPYFAELRKQGYTGRQKINQYTRYLGIAFAFIEGYAFAFAFLGKTSSPMEYMYIATILTAGTAFLLCLGDQISQKGIGNGLSLIILSGIVVSFPYMMSEAFKTFVLGNENIRLGQHFRHKEPEYGRFLFRQVNTWPLQPPFPPPQEQGQSPVIQLLFPHPQGYFRRCPDIGIPPGT